MPADSIGLDVVLLMVRVGGLRFCGGRSKRRRHACKRSPVSGVMEDKR